MPKKSTSKTSDKRKNLQEEEELKNQTPPEDDENEQENGSDEQEGGDEGENTSEQSKGDTGSPDEPEDTPEEELVTVKASELRAILDQNERMEEQIEDMRTDLNILRDASSRSRLEQAEDKHRPGDQRKRGHLRVFRGDIIVGWHTKRTSEFMKENRILRKGTKYLGEIMKFHYIYLAGKDENGKPLKKDNVVDLEELNQENERLHFRVLKENYSRNEQNEVEGTWVIEFEDLDLRKQYGEIEVDIRYVNA